MLGSLLRVPSTPLGHYPLFIVLFSPLIIMNTPTPEHGPEPQPPPRSTKEQEPSFDTLRLEVDALRAMLSPPPQAERREHREGDPKPSPR